MTTKTSERLNICHSKSWANRVVLLHKLRKNFRPNFRYVYKTQNAKLITTNTPEINPDHPIILCLITKTADCTHDL